MSKLNIQQKVGSYMEAHSKDLKRGQSRDVKLTNDEIYALEKGDLSNEQKERIYYWVDRHRGFKESYVYTQYKKNDWNEKIVQAILNQVIDNNKNNKEGDWATAGKKITRESQLHEKPSKNFRKESRGKHYEEREYSAKYKSRKGSSHGDASNRDESDEKDYKNSYTTNEGKFKQDETQRSFRKSRNTNNEGDYYSRNEPRSDQYKKQSRSRSPRSPPENSSKYEKTKKNFTKVSSQPFSSQQDDYENVYVAKKPTQSTSSSAVISGSSNARSNGANLSSSEVFVRKTKPGYSHPSSNHSNTQLAYIPKVRREEESASAHAAETGQGTTTTTATTAGGKSEKNGAPVPEHTSSHQNNNSARKASNASSDRSETALGGSEPYEEGHTAVEGPVQPLKVKNERNFIQNEKHATGPIGTNSHHGSSQKAEQEITISRAQPKDHHSKEQEYVKQGENNVGAQNQSSPVATHASHPTPAAPSNPQPTQSKHEPPSNKKENPPVNPVSTQAPSINIANVGLNFAPNTSNPAPLFPPQPPNISVCIYLKDNNTQKQWGHISIQLQLDTPNFSSIGISGALNQASSAIRKDYNHFN